jgi:peptide deformylase
MKILITPDQFLRKKAKPVKTLTKKTKKEIEQMAETLVNKKDPEGVGLAATQVGIDKRIFLLNLDKIHIFINPEITKRSKKMFTDVHKKDSDRWLEGCLSIPRVWGFVDRPYQVTLEYLTYDIDQKEPKLEKVSKTYTDIESAYVQHEADHLDGILFTDHILKQNGTIFEETKSGLVALNK